MNKENLKMHKVELIRLKGIKKLLNIRRLIRLKSSEQIEEVRNPGIKTA